mgnify:CR=1 FL=1
MTLRHVSFEDEDPVRQIACDEALLRMADAGLIGECLRFYELPCHAVVMGLAGRYRAETRYRQCVDDRVPVLRRSSGGGTVLLGPGCLVYSLILNRPRRPAANSRHAAYQWVLGRVASALAEIHIDARISGLSDIAVNKRKVGGSSQQWRRRFLLHHGTLMCNMDRSLMNKYLKHPPNEPDYRRGRSHESFTQNLTLPAGGLKDVLASEFDLPTGPLPAARIQGLQDYVDDLVQTKYGRDEWNLRR